MTAWLSQVGAAGGHAQRHHVRRLLHLGAQYARQQPTGAQVISVVHRASHGPDLSDLLGGLAMFFLVAFAVVLAGHVRRGERWVAVGAVAGAWPGIGLTFLLSFDLLLALDTKYLTDPSAQTLNLLQNDFFLPIALGVALFGILGGLSMVAGRMLPP